MCFIYGVFREDKAPTHMDLTAYLVIWEHPWVKKQNQTRPDKIIFEEAAELGPAS